MRKLVWRVDADALMSTYGDIGEHAAAEESNTSAHSEWMDDMVHMELTQGSWNPAFKARPAGSAA